MEQTQKPTSIRLSGDLRNRIQNIALISHKSANALMVQAIESFVEREEKRQAIRQECLAAHEHYVQTGLHLTNAEVVEWIDNVISGEKTPLPKCHI